MNIPADTSFVTCVKNVFELKLYPSCHERSRTELFSSNFWTSCLKSQTYWKETRCEKIL